MELKRMGYMVDALNMATSKTLPFLIPTKMIEEQDMEGIKEILKNQVSLDKEEVNIFIQISTKMVCQKAKQMWEFLSLASLRGLSSPFFSGFAELETKQTDNRRHLRDH